MSDPQQLHMAVEAGAKLGMPKSASTNRHPDSPASEEGVDVQGIRRNLLHFSKENGEDDLPAVIGGGSVLQLQLATASSGCSLRGVGRPVLAVKRDEPSLALDGWGPGQPAVDGIAGRIAREEWLRFLARDDAKEPHPYEWPCPPLYRLRLAEEERRWEHQLLVQCGTEDPREVAYYVVFALKRTTPEEPEQIAGMHWRIKLCFGSTTRASSGQTSTF